MAVKSKNKIKKKNKSKVIKKSAKPSERKSRPVMIPAMKAETKKESIEAQIAAEVRPERSEVKSAEKGEAHGSKKIENGDNSHLAKWIAPNFILTNGEVLIYKFSAVASPFMLIWSLLQGSYIVSITFFLALGVSLMHLARRPVAMECVIDLDGIKMGDKLYAYNLIESFEIDEEANVLKFKLKNAFLPLKEIYLDDQDPNYMRALLEYFLPEEKQEATLISREKKVATGEEEMSDEEFLSYLKKIEKNIEKEDS